MKHVRPALVASTLLFAACPPPVGNTTEGTTEDETGSETSTETTESEVTQSTPPSEPTTMGETSDTTVGESESNSMTGPDTDPETTDPTTGPPPGCVDAGDCGGDTPFCERGECVNCDGAANPDDACAGVDGSLPVCVNGACVECKVDGTECVASAPVCDETNTCVGCFEHSHCPQSSCNFESGACNDELYVLWVDKLANDCSVGDGTNTTPYCSVTEAINRLAMELDATWTVKIRQNNYIETPIVIPDGAIVTLSGWDGIPKLRAVDDSGATLTINTGAKVGFDHIQFSSNPDNGGVVCGGASVMGSDVRFSGNKLEGFNATECTSEFKRSVFYANLGGGIAAYGGSTKVVNSYVSGNGNQNFGNGGILSAQGNALTLVYSTVLNNLSTSGPYSLFCADDAGPAEIRNSVIIAFGSPSVGCPTGVFTTSVLDEGWVDQDTNLAATMADIANFFEMPTAGVYKAKADTAMKDLAQWKDGDPKLDYDGDARPGTDGAADWPGADVPAP